ncbi:MAG: hypothetical protein ACM32E_11955 [Gemmatimonadota bacterium]
MTAVLLVHGGLWEDMDAARFWRATGIEAGLRRPADHRRPARRAEPRCVADRELAALVMPAAVLPSALPNPAHQRRTASALPRLIPRMRELPGCPEPPAPPSPSTGTSS